MKAERESLKQWLSDNGLAEEYARYLHGGGHGRGPGGPDGPRHFSEDPTTLDSN